VEWLRHHLAAAEVTYFPPCKGAGGIRLCADESQIRTKTIWEDGTLFCRAEYLMKNLSLIEAMPETTFDEIVNKYVEMNVAHPFMEGNARSTRIWFDLIFKKRLGLCEVWGKIDKKTYLEAMRRSTTDASLIKARLQGDTQDSARSGGLEQQTRLNQQQTDRDLQRNH